MKIEQYEQCQNVCMSSGKFSRTIVTQYGQSPGELKIVSDSGRRAMNVV